ncbi:MAG: F0F1 ATP synthase subunit B [Chloroflexi bacterium]|nr:F0F1 ATP synthase subunit B [Chloroflexota bacterium]MBI3763170.1 F0F1 ATP synthase subunit B [Chloroflexota bacterium]
MEALGINLGYFLVQLLNFLILLIVLYAWAYKPILKMLDDRKEKIAQGLEDARIAAEARGNAERQAEKIVANAQVEAAKIVSEATGRAEKAAADVRAAAEAEVVRIKKAAAEDAVLERNRVLGEVRNQVAALAMAAANKIVGEALDEQRQRTLIAEFFSGVKAGKVTVLDASQASGAAAEVTSALPLTETEQAAVKSDLKGVSSISFRVDPTILGGLVVRVGDKILDGSVAGKLEGLRQAMR